MKMYILIKDTCPDNIAPLIAAHAAMGAYLKFQGNSLMDAWSKSPHFKKVVCKVSPAVFEKAKEYGRYNTITENHHKELGEIGMAFDIQENYPKFFNFLSMWRVG